MTLTPTRSEAAQAELSARLNDPVVAEALASLLDRAELLAVLMQGLDQFVARSEVIGDSLLASLAELRATADSTTVLAGSQVDLMAVAEASASLAAVLPKAAPGMVAAVESGAIDKLFASGVVGTEAVDQVAVFAHGLVKGSRAFVSDPVRVGGPLSLMRLLKDPDISRALSFFATITMSIGRELAAAQSTNQR